MHRTEIIVASLILGFILLTGFLNVKTLISRAKSAEAQVQLEQLYKLEKLFLYNKGRYSPQLEEIGFVAYKPITKGGPGNYVIEVDTIGAQRFRGFATAVVDFDGDGIYNKWEIDDEKDLKEIVMD